MKNKFENKTIDYCVILIFAILKFRNIGRSTFRPNFWPPLFVNSIWFQLFDNLPILEKKQNPTLILQSFMLSKFKNYLEIFTWPVLVESS